MHSARLLTAAAQCFFLLLLVQAAIATAEWNNPEKPNTVDLKAIHLMWLNKDKAARLDTAFPERLAATTGKRLGHDLRPFPSDDKAGYTFVMQAHGNIYRMELVPSRSLLSPSAVVETRGNDETDVVIEQLDHDDITGCHLHGSVSVVGGNADDVGRAAISICDGNMTGFLKFAEDQLFIEPARTKDKSGWTAPGHPHLVYKRAMGVEAENDSKSGSFCHVDSHGSDQLQRHHGGHNTHHHHHHHHHHASHARVARQTSKCLSTKKYYIETLIVGDPFLLQKLKRLNLNGNKAKEYILTLMNMVQILYERCSTGYDITFTVSRILLWKSLPRGFQFNSHSVKLLKHFCNWQQIKIKPTIKYDYAIYLTGRQLCWKSSTEGCGELGRAYLNAICLPSFNCQVVSETGMRTGFAIAHEFGHSLGMLHDGDGGRCSRSDGYLMAPIISGQSNLYQWSSCSRTSIKDFFAKDRIGEKCLLDSPSDPIPLPSVLPGEFYSLDRQCVFQQMRLDSKFCQSSSKKAVICQALWCTAGNRCQTLFVPAVEGSPCDRGKVCIKGQCVSSADVSKIGPNSPIHGGWSGWGFFSQCSRSCGGGIQHQSRTCTNPRPIHGGKNCSGDSQSYQLCNKMPCPGVVDWRNVMCSQMKDSKGPLVLYHNKDDPCNLWCFNRTRGAPVLVSAVLNGLQCTPDSNNRCMSGKCIIFGCVDKWKSDITFDQCGVCGGQNKTCSEAAKSVSVSFSEKGCKPVVTWERGADKLGVTVSSGEVSLVLSVEENSIVFQSSNHSSSTYACVRIEAAGSIIYYEKTLDGQQLFHAVDRLEEKLSLKICNPTNRPTTVKVEYRHTTHNKLPVVSNNPSLDTVYIWQKTQTECSKTCEGGVRRVSYRCYNPSRGLFANHQICGTRQPPTSRILPCNSDVPCPAYKWVPFSWRPCSTSCGNGLQSRPVHCRKSLGNGRNLRIKFCKGSRPPLRRRCSGPPCPAVWNDWQATTPCGQTCGRSVVKLERKCSRPRACKGSAVLYSLCSQKPCSIDTYSAQCKAKFGNEAESVYSREYALCRVSCQLAGVAQTIAALDGTRCHFGSERFCLDGVCQPVNCTGAFASPYSDVDRCGVCGGNGTNCQLIAERCRIKNTLPGTYDVGLLRAGTHRPVIFATSQSSMNDSIYIVLKSSAGIVRISTSQFQGHSVGTNTGFDTKFTFRRGGATQFSITATGRINQDVKVEMVLTKASPLSAVPRLDIQYFYFGNKNGSKKSYAWLWVKSLCSASCGTGKFVYLPKCAEKAFGQQVTEIFCASLKRPQNRLYGDCAASPCPTPTPTPARWVIFRDYSRCPVTCGSGVQHRIVRCFIGSRKVGLRKCEGMKAPESSRTCANQPC